VKLYFSPTSPYVRKVMVAAIECGLAGRIEKIATGFPILPGSDLARDNPLLQLPCLKTEDGEALFDSPVICDYLDSLHPGPRLIPAEGRPRRTALRRQALGDGILDATILVRYERLRPEPYRWSEWIDKQMLKIRGGLDALEAEAGTPAEPPTIGCITIGCALGYLDLRLAEEDWRGTRPKLAEWFDAFSRRPSMQETAPQG
jgi:glutathione S-transferase